MTTNSLSACIETQKSDGAVSFVVFGDSLSDPGNVARMTKGRFPDPAYHKLGTFSDGPVTPDYLIEALRLSRHQVRNFACGGATIDNNAIAGTNFYGKLVVPGVAQQIDAFWQQMREGHVALSAHPIAFVWVGVNDPFASDTVTGAESGARLARLLDVLLAREIFHQLVVVNLPHFDAAPYFVPLARKRAKQRMRQYVDDFSASLGDTAARLSGKYASCQVHLVDAMRCVDQVLLRPEAFGFKASVLPCHYDAERPFDNKPGAQTVCARPEEHVFWDVFHPSSALHRMIAAEAFGSMQRRGAKCSACDKMAAL